MIFGVDLTISSLVAFILKHGYAFLFGWVFLEQLGLPIGAAPLLLAAGALVGYGKMNFAFIFLVVWSASLISDLFWYYLGKKRGGKVLSFLCRVSLNPDFCIGRTKDLFARHGAPSLLVAKFLPGINTITPPLAGILRMRVHHFMFWDTLGIAIWVGAFGLLGHQFRQQLEWVALKIMKLGNWAGVVVITLLAVFIGVQFWRRKRLNRKIPHLGISPNEVMGRISAEETPLILDVRSPLDVIKSPHYIPGAWHLPLEKLPQKYKLIPRDREIIIYCS